MHCPSRRAIQRLLCLPLVRNSVCLSRRLLNARSSAQGWAGRGLHQECERRWKGRESAGMTCANLLSQRRPGAVVSQQQEGSSNPKIAANADRKATGITLFSKGGGRLRLANRGLQMPAGSKCPAFSVVHDAMSAIIRTGPVLLLPAPEPSHPLRWLRQRTTVLMSL
ncbi:hypothetical protein NB725_003331 [Pantoea ananatis]|nr:hypothetical protein [Pantoea ananatis]MCW0338961.1 hypothetical protein [Pantoea ananatis]MCW0359256.1 hypothetical protein [Pantoea ananatis]MCW0363721.1 hypothetical protein [Pantoea ananatis]